MSTFHINEKGEAKPCSARPGNCPLGSEGNHYSTADEARNAYEASMGSGTVVMAPEVETTVRYDIPAFRATDAIAKIEKANRRAERAGIAERFAYDIETYEVRREEDGLTKIEERAKITIDRPVLVHEGWTFAGTMSWDPEVGLVTRMVPDQELYSRPEAEYCDVCETRRHRNDTYIVQKDGEQKQVGSACLERFMGIKPSGLWMMEFDLDEVYDEAEPSLGSEKWQDVRRDSVEMVALGLAAVEEFGWTSRSQARESYGDREATADVVENLLGAPANTEDERVFRAKLQARAEELRKEAEEVLKEARNLEGNSEYVENLRNVAGGESVSMRNLPLLLSAIATKRRAEEDRARRESAAKKAAISDWVGTPGQKLTDRVVTVESTKVVSSSFGSSTLINFVDDEGNRIKTFYSGSFAVEKGKTYVLKSSTVKDHTEWNGAKETMVSRVKLETMRPDTLPPSALPADSHYAQAWTVEENAAANTKAHREIKKRIKAKAKDQGGWNTDWDRPNDPELIKEWDRAEKETNANFHTRYRELIGEAPVEDEAPAPPVPKPPAARF